MKKRRSSQRRRHSDDEYDDYYDDEERPDRDAGYRSEGHNGRQADMRKSYDGGADYDEINDRPRRRRSRPRRRRDNDKYGHDDGYGRAPRNVRPGADGVEYGTGVVPPPQSGTAPMRDPYAAGAATAAAAAGQNPYGSPVPSQQAPSINNSQNEGPAPQLTSTLRGGMATGYVPYAHIYGGPPNPQGQPGFAPPPSESGSVQPNFMNQIAAPAAAPGVRPHPQPGYQQNPYAQEAIPGSQPAYIPDPYAQARRLDQQQYDQRRNNEYTSSEDEAYSKPRSRRTKSRRSRRDRSSSRDRYSDDDSYHDRRTHSERPPPPKNTTNMADHRGKSQLKGPFDVSQRGLGFSAVGALAGGLIGSEFGKGKGPVPAGVGSLVGAIVANAFQGRTR